MIDNSFSCITFKPSLCRMITRVLLPPPFLGKLTIG